MTSKRRRTSEKIKEDNDKIMDFIMKHGSATRPEIMKYIGVSYRVVGQILTKMEKDNILVTSPILRSRFSKYEISKEVFA